MLPIDCIVPVYNEVKTVRKVLENLLRMKEIGKVIVVDDGSDDGSREEIDRIRNGKLIKIFKSHGGKGSAVKEGLKYVTSEYVFLQDSDGEYPTENFYLLYPYAYLFPAVVGERLVPISSLTVRGFFANRLIIGLLRERDVFSGQRIVKSDILREIPLRDGFEIETQMTLYFKKRGLPVKYVPVPYYPRGWEEKKIGFTDFLRILREVIRGGIRSPYKKDKVREGFEACSSFKKADNP